MKFVALISGGKDSIYTLCKLKEMGHKLVALCYLESTSSNIDSFMYQSVGKEVIDLYAECLNVPLCKYNTKAECVNMNLEYNETEVDEVEDMYRAIKNMKEKYDFEGVSSGAILSTYQKNRVQNVCQRHDLISMTPLWNLNQEKLLDEMIIYGIEARIVKIAEPGFGKDTVGLDLQQMRGKIRSLMKGQDSLKLFAKYFNFCGEGGEYESIVCYAPGFKKQILIEKYVVERHPEECEKEWNVFYMRIIDSKLIEI